MRTTTDDDKFEDVARFEAHILLEIIQEGNFHDHGQSLKC